MSSDRIKVPAALTLGLFIFYISFSIPSLLPSLLVRASTLRMRTWRPRM
jgi:hypothetical protein